MNKIKEEIIQKILRKLCLLFLSLWLWLLPYILYINYFFHKNVCSKTIVFYLVNRVQ